MSTLDWAKREVELACKRENPDRKPGEWDYGCACYESALKALKSLLEDDHSAFSIGLTKQILNRLIDMKPLTPIEDTDDVWEYSWENTDAKIIVIPKKDFVPKKMTLSEIEEELGYKIKLVEEKHCCETCKFQSILFVKEPCNKCRKYDKWESK